MRNLLIMKNFSLRSKLMILVIAPTVIGTAASILIASFTIKREGEQALKEKSTAILSRMEAVRHYIANQGMLDYTIEEMKKKYPEGQLTVDDKKRVLNQVPIMASMKVGMSNAGEENYEFRVASKNPRNENNRATAEEAAFIDQFEGNETIIHKDQKSNAYWVMRPVYLKANEGCLNCHGNPADSPWGNGKDVLGANMEGWSDGELRGMFKIVSDLTPVQEKARAAIFNIATWGFMICFVAIILGLSITKKINNVIEKIIKVTGKVSKGDLSDQIEVSSNDELGQLSKYINLMIHSLSKVIGEVKESASRLTMATQEISSSSNSISEGAQKQASEFEEISSSIQSTADSGLNATQQTRKSSIEANEAGKAMSESMSAMNAIKDSSSKIEEAILVISEIAYQTNLLALNAAVEAARAGEHGKGFTVVAKEVKKLAEKSASSAEEIKVNIQTTLQDIQKGAETSDNAAGKIKSIVEAISKVSEEIENISLSSQQQAKAMENNTNITTSNAASAEELAASSDQLASQAQILYDIVEKFKTKKEDHYSKTSHSKLTVKSVNVKPVI